LEAILTTDPVAIAVADKSHVSAARLAVQRLTRVLGFDELHAGRAAIAVTEAVSNMVRHAGGGTFVVRALERGTFLGVEMLAVDSGPGMGDFGASSRDGHSTAGTPGTGLGAIQRQSGEFEVYTRPGSGTILRMVFWNAAHAPAEQDYEIGAVCVPKPGEEVCGDAWEARPHPGGISLMVADGLGHGPDARRAAHEATEVLRRNPEYSALRTLDTAHGRLRPTRGAAVAVMRHQQASGQLDFAGVGNIAACVIAGTARRAMVSHNGIVGHNMHKSQEYRYEWPARALLVAHSDGLETQWNLADFPGLDACHPAVIAAHLFRHHSRKRDDVTVLVARSIA
jgi:anti-sigma regulatory factor (Ser/Thr protein kinase)